MEGQASKYSALSRSTASGLNYIRAFSVQPMMKRFLHTTLILGSFAMLMQLTSCKKCYQCTALDVDDNAVFEYSEICGTRNDFENYEARCEAEFGNFDFTCSCEEL